MSSSRVKKVNLALQGGGSHGAFAWGVLDKLIEDGRLEVEGLSATSAGAMNASVFAYGMMQGGPDGARQALYDFWLKVSSAGSLYAPLNQQSDDVSWIKDVINLNPAVMLYDSWVKTLSPYEFNPTNINPLRDILSDMVDFKKLVECECTKLFISTTNVRTGKVRIFRNQEITLDVVMASATLPDLFQAVEIDGMPYWDGGYTGNPALFPLFNHTESNDIIILHVNPLNSDKTPKTAGEIHDRLNEITFNTSLLKELRAIAFVNKLHEQGWLKEEFKSKLKHVLVHSIRADGVLSHLSAESKFNSDWTFINKLKDLGREAATLWLDQNFKHIGKRATVDLHKEFLEIGIGHSG